MHKKPLALAFLLLLTAAAGARAELLGEYELKSGPDHCPYGLLQFIVHDDGEKRNLLFGVRQNWPMTLKNRSTVVDPNAGGCHYVWACTKTTNAFSCTTTRSRCPNPDHNDVIQEDMVLRGKTMTYSFRAGIAKFDCRYTKIGELER